MYKRYNYQLYMYNHLDIYKRIYNETWVILKCKLSINYASSYINGRGRILTMGINVTKFIVQVEQASDAPLKGWNWPVACQDQVIELKMRRGFLQIQ